MFRESDIRYSVCDCVDFIIQLVLTVTLLFNGYKSFNSNTVPTFLGPKSTRMNVAILVLISSRYRKYAEDYLIVHKYFMGVQHIHLSVQTNRTTCNTVR